MLDLNWWGIGLIVCRFYDAYKYNIQSKKIRKVGLSRGHSRDFGNIALGVDCYMLGYFIFKNFDIWMIITTLIMIAMVLEYWITMYYFYPYRMRGCPNFRRPNLWVYFVNSIQADNYRKRL
jgi:uncharacterized membrane-anchored protein